MKTPRRARLILIWLLTNLALLGGLHWRWFDNALTAIVLAFFLVGSIVLVVKTVWHPERGFQFGQLAALPRSWQRWILDEDHDPRGTEY